MTVHLKMGDKRDDAEIIAILFSTLAWINI